MEKEEVKLLKVGAKQKDKHQYGAAFLSMIEEDHATMVKDEKDPFEDSAVEDIDMTLANAKCQPKDRRLDYL